MACLIASTTHQDKEWSISRKLFISIIFNIYLTTFKLAGYNSKCFKENIQLLLLNRTTVMEIVMKMMIRFIRLVYV
jgi:hypothetical protein